jgi:hypothetical protein
MIGKPPGTRRDQLGGRTDVPGLAGAVVQW